MTGLFETMLVRVLDGERVVPLLPFHLERLVSSVRTIGGVTVSTAAVEQALGSVSPNYDTDHVVRLECRVERGAATLIARARALPAITLPLRLIPVRSHRVSTSSVVPPSASFKSLDRGDWERHEQDVKSFGAEPLLVDDDGRVLESSRGNLLVAIAGEYVTPPLDGRILPGIGRAILLAGLRVQGVRVVERHLHLEELATANVWSTNAVSGPRPAWIEDGARPGAGATAAKLSTIWEAATGRVCRVPRQSR